eukprot:4920620-Pleurochrysis_carterae.AAC.1
MSAAPPRADASRGAMVPRLPAMYRPHAVPTVPTTDTVQTYDIKMLTSVIKINGFSIKVD